MRKLPSLFAFFAIICALALSPAPVSAEVSAAPSINARLVALDKSNMVEEWGSSIVSGNRAQIWRSFYSDGSAGSGFVAYVRVYRTSAQAQKEWSERSFPGQTLTPRPAPLRSVDAYRAVSGYYDGDTMYTQFWTLSGRTVMGVTYSGDDLSEKLGSLLQCEALQNDRLAKPGKAGKCPLAPQ